MKRTPMALRQPRARPIRGAMRRDHRALHRKVAAVIAGAELRGEEVQGVDGSPRTGLLPAKGGRSLGLDGGASTKVRSYRALGRLIAALRRITTRSWRGRPVPLAPRGGHWALQHLGGHTSATSCLR